MFSRCPRYLSHGPAAEMWSVVHLPCAFSRIGSFDEVVAVPRRERLEQLQPVAVGAHDHLDALALGRRSEEALVARLESA